MNGTNDGRGIGGVGREACPVRGRARRLRIVVALLLSLGWTGWVGARASGHQAATPAEQTPQDAPRSGEPATPDPERPVDMRIDAATGRARATWPPDVLFEYRHLRLEIDLADVHVAKLSADETLDIAAIGAERTEVVLDCDGPSVERVLVRDGSSAGTKPAEGVKTSVEARFTQSAGKLRITLPRALAPGQAATLAISYTLDFSPGAGPNGKSEGLTWLAPKPPAEGEDTPRSHHFPQIFSQGQAQLNSHWFPCLDFPSYRLPTEIIVTADAEYEVVSNGRLVSKGPGTVGAGGKARTRWHWLQDKPHPVYLVALFIGRCAVVDLASAGSPVPMPLYCPLGEEESSRVTFSRTPEMLTFFETLFGEPYPWDKYAQVVLRDFVWGGMENTSASFLSARSSHGSDGRWDDLISHELAHQWLGDLITTRTWAHLWLNEGWAAYCECLWAEHVGATTSPEEATTRYRKTLMGYVDGQRKQNRGYAPVFPALVSARYANPDRAFDKLDDPYAKGAVVLHMLRRELGDGVFFAGLREYVRRFALSQVETDEFRRVMERVSGRSLEFFFEQWVMRPGIPHLAVDLAWNEWETTLRVVVEQTQRIDGDNPAYEFSLPVLLKENGSAGRTVRVPVAGRRAEASFKLGMRPAGVEIDPDVCVLSVQEIRTQLTPDAGASAAPK